MHRIELKLCAQNNLIKCSVCILTASKRKRKKNTENQNTKTKTEFSAFNSKRVENCEETHNMANGFIFE